MPMYRIDIDGRKYEGYYGSAPDAVFGAMLKDYNECYRDKESGMLIGVQRIDKKGKHKARRRVE